MTMRRKITASLLALVTGATLAVATAPSAQAVTPLCPVWSENNINWATSHIVSLHVTCVGGQQMRAHLQSLSGTLMRSTFGLWRSQSHSTSVADRPSAAWTPIGSTAERLIR